MILSEEKINKIDNYLNEAISLLTEVEELDDRTFVWDLAKERLDKSFDEVENKSEAEDYLRNLLRKIKSVPKKIKVKLAKYVISLLIGFTAISNISNIINDEAPEIKNQLSLSIPELKEKPKEESKEEEKEEIESIQTPNSSSNWLYEFLKGEEGYRNKGYKIGDGKITIGWGHAEDRRNSKYKVGQEISKSEAEKLLKQDVATAEDAVNDVLEEWDNEGITYKIDQNMYDAMVSIAYNRGRGAFRRSDFLQLVKQGNYLEAKDEILKMNTRAYKKYPGLKKRREKEAEKFGENLYKMIALLNNEKKDDMISESYKFRLKNLAGII